MPAKKINEAPPLTRTQCAALLDMDVSYFYRITKADDTIIRTDTVGGRGPGQGDPLLLDDDQCQPLSFSATGASGVVGWRS